MERGPVPLGRDFDDLETGTWSVNGTKHANAPSIGSEWYAVVVLPLRTQVAISSGRMAIRGQPAGIWTQWVFVV